MSPTVISHSLQPHRAFHSTLSTIIALEPPDEPDCSFFALYTFPQSIIIDRYELIDRHLSFEFWGESNLELPVFALNQSANSLLLINATPTGAHPKQVITDIPVHARYGEPGMAHKSPHTITISSPACFWACPPSGVYDMHNALPYILKLPQQVYHLRFPPSHLSQIRPCLVHWHIFPSQGHRRITRRFKSLWLPSATCFLSRWGLQVSSSWRSYG